jgi:hypothetical protein
MSRLSEPFIVRPVEIDLECAVAAIDFEDARHLNLL